MTFREAKREFKQTHAEFLDKHKTDLPAKRQAWSMFIDGAVRDGRAQERYAKNWAQLY